MKNAEGYTPLHLAAWHRGATGASAVQLLLQAWPDAAAEKDEEGYTPLHMAAENQYGQTGVTMVQMLVEKAPQAATMQNKDGCTPLARAAEFHGEWDMLGWWKCASNLTRLSDRWKERHGCRRAAARHRPTGHQH